MKELNLDNLKKDDLNNIIGIYELIINKKSYIGSSCDIYCRLREHFSDLKKNQHANKKLQNTYNKHLLIYYSIIETQKTENFLIEREEYFYNIKGYYNLQSPKGTIKSQCKKIYQFDINQNFIAEFPSLNEAKRKLNLNQSGISKALTSNNNYYKGYLWSFEKNCKKRQNKTAKYICLYDLDGFFVNDFFTLREAAVFIKNNTQTKASLDTLSSKLSNFKRCNFSKIENYQIRNEKFDRVEKYINQYSIYLLKNNEIVHFFKDKKECMRIMNWNKDKIEKSLYYGKLIDNVYLAKYVLQTKTPLNGETPKGTISC